MAIEYLQAEIDRLETLNLTEKSTHIAEQIVGLKEELIRMQTNQYPNHWDSGYMCGYKG